MNDTIEYLIIKITTRSARFLLLVGLLYVLLFTLALVKANAQSGSTSNVGQNNAKIVQQTVQKGNYY